MMNKMLKHFQKTDPKLYEIALRVQHLINIQKVAEENFLSALCDHIISQQLAVKAADAIFGRFILLFKDGKIEPKLILSLSDEKLRGVGLSFAKIKYIKDLAQKIESHELILEELPKLPDDEVITKLTQVKGIGKWTAEMFLISSLGREDIFSYGDLGLMNAVVKLYKIDGKPTMQDLEKLENNWKPYRSFASKVLWKSLTLV